MIPVAAAILGGLVGALIGLLIALIGQSREDERLRRSEAWRQQTAKQERIRAEFATALRLMYQIEAYTQVDHWYAPSVAERDPDYVKRLAEFGPLYQEAHLADIRMRLEGATEAWQALNEVALQHQAFRRALRQLEEDGPKAAALVALKTAHEAILAVSDTIHVKLAAYLDALTPPGPPPPESGLRIWLRQAEAWLRR